MDFEHHDHGGYRVVTLTGDVDLSCAADSRRAILDAIQHGHNTLVDLAQVNYIDSSGIASLVEGYQKAREAGLEFGLVSVSDSALRVLELARLNQVFPIHDSVEARIASDG
ncbi:MAG: STAS domain-containing protein [Gammaproteobacteria bacterium]